MGFSARAYHPSVYKRGGGAAAGTLGKAFAYKRPQFDDGGSVDFDDPVFNQPQQQPRQPGLQERVFKFQANKDQLYAGSPFNTAMNTAALEQLSDRYKQESMYLGDLSKAKIDVAQGMEGEEEKDAENLQQDLARGSGAPRIHVDHPGSGLVMNIHLGPVGVDAISLAHSGGVSLASSL